METLHFPVLTTPYSVRWLLMEMASALASASTGLFTLRFLTATVFPHLFFLTCGAIFDATI
jgi:hypothetical protein